MRALLLILALLLTSPAFGQAERTLVVEADKLELPELIVRPKAKSLGEKIRPFFAFSVITAGEGDTIHPVGPKIPPTGRSVNFALQWKF